MSKSRDLKRLFGYTNEENPFGDDHLSKGFVWKKKKEDNTNKAVEPNAVEAIQRVRQRRKDREMDKKEFERLKQEELRIRDTGDYDSYQEKEDHFHLTQSFVRSRKRLLEGRGTLIDVLAKNQFLYLPEAISSLGIENTTDTLMNEEQKSQDTGSLIRMDIENPVKLIGDLTAISSIHSLIDQVRNFNSFEPIAYWETILALCSFQIRKLSKSGSIRKSEASIEGDIQEMLEAQSKSELLELQGEMQANALQANTIDVEYWETVNIFLRYYLSKIEMNECFALICVERQKLLKKLGPALSSSTNTSIAASVNSTMGASDSSNVAMQMLALEKAKDFEEEEESFNDSMEVPLSASKPGMVKPRYFNRVKSGFDWNKYNQTHYDEDNPPPKTVQGYKFNIFYPELVDKTNTPSFKVERVPSNPDFCIIRFQAGAPYEDIAFQIVNREWEQSQKYGFKCVFERGILHLYFTFKRHRYRRYMSNDEDRYHSMSLATAGLSSIANRHQSASMQQQRLTNNVDDIQGARANHKSLKYQKQSFHSPNDIAGSTSNILHKPCRQNGQDPRFDRGDIVGSKPNAGINFHTTRKTNPLEPNYQLQSCELVQVVTPKFLRETNNVKDIEKAQSTLARSFKTRDWHNVGDIDGAQADWKASHARKVREAPPRDIMNCADIIGEGFKSKRLNDVLNPVYHINGYTVQDDEKSKPKPLPQHRNSPDFNLTTNDIDGASPAPYKANRSESEMQVRNTNLVADIAGATADTVKHGIRSKRHVDPICPTYHTLDGGNSAWNEISPKKQSAGFVGPTKARKEKSSIDMTPIKRRSVEQLNSDVSSVRSLK